MAEGQRKSWRELCNAALDAKDPDELLNILQELNRVLKHEEQVRRDFRQAARTSKVPAKSEISSFWKSKDTSAYFEHQAEDASGRQESRLR